MAGLAWRTSEHCPPILFCASTHDYVFSGPGYMNRDALFCYSTMVVSEAAIWFSDFMDQPETWVLSLGCTKWDRFFSCLTHSLPDMLSFLLAASITRNLCCPPAKSYRTRTSSFLAVPSRNSRENEFSLCPLHALFHTHLSSPSSLNWNKRITCYTRLRSQNFGMGDRKTYFRQG